MRGQAHARENLLPNLAKQAHSSCNGSLDCNKIEDADDSFGDDPLVVTVDSEEFEFGDEQKNELQRKEEKKTPPCLCFTITVLILATLGVIAWVGINISGASTRNNMRNLAVSTAPNAAQSTEGQLIHKDSKESTEIQEISTQNMSTLAMTTNNTSITAKNSQEVKPNMLSQLISIVCLFYDFCFRHHNFAIEKAVQKIRNLGEPSDRIFYIAAESPEPTLGKTLIELEEKLGLGPSASSNATSSEAATKFSPLPAVQALVEKFGIVEESDNDDDNRDITGSSKHASKETCSKDNLLATLKLIQEDSVRNVRDVGRQFETRLMKWIGQTWNGKKIDVVVEWDGERYLKIDVSVGWLWDSPGNQNPSQKVRSLSCQTDLVGQNLVGQNFSKQEKLEDLTPTDIGSPIDTSDSDSICE